MLGPRPMARLLQGDVGSGKTVVATGALLQAVASEAQGAIMVPTEILAEQHFRTICGLLGKEPGLGWGNEVVQSFDSFLDRPIRVGLLIGDIRQGAKREVHTMIEDGHIDIVVGTQALIQRDVEFRDLALIVVDEQHRFGVMQRAALRQKGASPHLLVMTATPIPRTLALTLYGDLDLTILDEMPPGRLPIETKWGQAPPEEPSLRLCETAGAEGTTGVCHLSIGRGVGGRSRPGPRPRSTSGCPRTYFGNFDLDCFTAA